MLFPPTESDLPNTTIKVDPSLHEDIHREAAERGISIIDLIRLMFDFFVGTRESAKFHPLQHNRNDLDYTERERIWQEDLIKLQAESKI